MEEEEQNEDEEEEEMVMLEKGERRTECRWTAE